MRKLRLKPSGTSFFHVMSRIIERRFFLGVQEKTVFLDMLSRAADFSGVQVLSFCLMDNHFHLLIRVPERQDISDDELLHRLKILYRESELERVLWEYDRFVIHGSETARNSFRKRYLVRMYDLSEFMKTLKQRFSIWFNRNNVRLGPLWEGRFKSVLIQGPTVDGHVGNRALLLVAAYIELNAVRAGMVNDPSIYDWCSFGRAIQGSPKSRQAIVSLLELISGKRVEWSTAQQIYHACLLGRLENEAVASSIADKYTIVLNEISILLMRQQDLTDGYVLGSRDFIRKMIRVHTHCFSSKRPPPHPLDDRRCADLCTSNRSRKTGTTPNLSAFF